MKHEGLILKILEKLLDSDDKVDISKKEVDCRADKLIGQYCIIRCRDAGVHAGILRFHSEREVELDESRRLWYWKCLKEHSLSGLARWGLHEDSTIAGKLNGIRLLDACEIIPVSETAIRSFKDAKIHTPQR